MEKEKKMSAKAVEKILKRELLKTAEHCVTINKNINDEYELIQVFLTPDNKSVKVLLRDIKENIIFADTVKDIEPLGYEMLLSLVTESIANHVPCDRDVAVVIYRNDKRHIVSSYFDLSKKDTAVVLGLGITQILNKMTDFDTFFHIASAVFEKMAHDMPKSKAKRFISDFLDNYYDEKNKDEEEPKELVIPIKNSKYKS